MKKKLILCVLLCSVTILSSIEPKDYRSMTDHDRISLAVSYYEVFLKWKDEEGKKGKEAKSYLNEAYKIEPEVDKYYRGELEIPEKTISFNWDDIFPEEDDEESIDEESIDEESIDEESIDKESIDKESIDKESIDEESIDEESIDEETSNDVTTNDAWTKIVEIINERNFEDLANYFNDVIDIAGTDLRITRDELSETLQDWLATENNAAFPEHSASFVNENVLKVVLTSVPENFFLPISGDTFYVIFSNGVVVGFSEDE